MNVFFTRNIETENYVQDHTDNMMNTIKKSIRRRSVAFVAPHGENESHVVLNDDEGSDEEDNNPSIAPIKYHQSRRATLTIRKGSLDNNLSVIRYNEHNNSQQT